MHPMCIIAIDTETGRKTAMSRNGARFQQLAVLFVVAVLVNYPWELAQSRLYVQPQRAASMWWHCLVASLGDGVAMLAIFGLLSLTHRRWDWFQTGDFRRYLMVSIFGFAIALVVEWWSVHVGRTWTYAPAMPQVPGLRLGVVPLLQMVVLPPLVFSLAFARPFGRRSE
jgi:hypothetical protein